MGRRMNRMADGTYIYRTVPCVTALERLPLARSVLGPVILKAMPHASSVMAVGLRNARGVTELAELRSERA
jgi:hypothetical protein